MTHFRQLTEAQQAVVAHEKGPALVFAVAGAGKTTAMVHRIRRLVRDGVFAPGEVLATSFGKRNQLDLEDKLRPWPRCRGVHVHTLHALGRRIIARAQKAGYRPQLRLDGGEQALHDVERWLLGMAMHEARRRAEPYAPELETIDRRDFLAYVAACKGNLLYADLQQVQLPAAARKSAGEAVAPTESLSWYLDLYRLFEHLRLENGYVTFADMLMTGWEILVCYPDVLEAVQAQYRCVLVDEYQDINRAQSEILDLITRPHRNYMAIGDDDQTIYEWRGADPHFILDFDRRYEASRYVIGENFRCPAAPLILANRVIAHNEERAQKRQTLTRGFAGQTKFHVDADLASMAQRIVDRIERLPQEGWQWQDVAVLVRLNAQTPHIEQALITADIPFRVSTPFYRRREIKTLIYYVRLAWVEWAMQTERSLSPAQKEWFAEAWQAVYNRPKRYLSRELHNAVRTAVLSQAVAPTAALRRLVPRAPHEGIAESMEALVEDVAWLAVRLKSEAAGTLREFEQRLAYRTYLRESSGFPQTGEGRAANVEAFIDYARGKGTVLDFMQHVRDLARRKIGRERSATQDAVTLSTIHGAKGLEWPVVFVAQCNQDVLPFNGERSENLEEERRLFYVALTRSSQHLYLHSVKDRALSQFLDEAGYRQVLSAVRQVQTLLDRDPATWKAAEAWTVAKTVSAYGLESYFLEWWEAPPAHGKKIAATMQRFLAQVEARDAWGQVDLDPQDRALWQRLAPEGAAEEAQAAFPGVEQFLAAPEERAPVSGVSSIRT